mmetsp:Transcript_23922/g.60185  ORF Transcript_23922/g.60185 Transcript_23922/m.60185 type:complete len:86 (+) Transcript_23922:181-438(+)
MLTGRRQPATARAVQGDPGYCRTSRALRGLLAIWLRRGVGGCMGCIPRTACRHSAQAWKLHQRLARPGPHSVIKPRCSRSRRKSA